MYKKIQFIMSGIALSVFDGYTIDFANNSDRNTWIFAGLGLFLTALWLVVLINYIFTFRIRRYKRYLELSNPNKLNNRFVKIEYKKQRKVFKSNKQLLKSFKIAASDKAQKEIETVKTIKFTNKKNHTRNSFKILFGSSKLNYLMLKSKYLDELKNQYNK